MSIWLLVCMVAGVLWGRSMAEWRPLWRRGLPITAIVLGLFLFRQDVRALGAQAVQDGALTSTGFSGLMLMLLGLLALLTLVTIYLGGALGRAQRLSRRRK